MLTRLFEGHGWYTVWMAVVFTLFLFKSLPVGEINQYAPSSLSLSTDPTPRFYMTTFDGIMGVRLRTLFFSQHVKVDSAFFLAWLQMETGSNCIEDVLVGWIVACISGLLALLAQFWDTKEHEEGIAWEWDQPGDFQIEQVPWHRDRQTMVSSETLRDS